MWISLKNIFFLCPLIVLWGCGKAPAFQRAPSIIEQGQNTFSEKVSLSSYKLRAQIFWQETPSTEELGSFIINFYDEKGLLVDPEDEFKIEPLMPDMGHGTSPVLISRIRQGLWLVEEVSLYMPGRWLIPVVFYKGEVILGQINYEITL